MDFVISILAAYSPWVLSHGFQKNGVFSWLTLEKCSLCQSHKYFQILLGVKMVEPLETVSPCHLTQRVRSGRGERPCLDTKRERYLLCGETHPTQPARGETDTWGSFHRELSPLQSKVGLTLPEENDTESTQTKEGQTSPMLSGKPFLHGLMPIIFFFFFFAHFNLSIFIFCSLVKESKLAVINWIPTVC